MNPSRLTPYLVAETIKAEKRDREMWHMGIYVYRATLTAVENVLAGKKASLTYLEEPLMVTARKESETTELSEDEQMAQVNALFTALSAMAANSRIDKNKNSENDSEGKES